MRGWRPINPIRQGAWSTRTGSEPEARGLLTPVASERPILVVGGGIAGLALALSLARHGRTVVVLESRPRFETAGAGIQLGSNAVGILARLGVAERLRAKVAEPAALAVFAGRSGRALAELPLGAWCTARYGAPYWTMHRSDLHDALAAAAAAEPRISLRTGFALAAVRQETSRVLAQAVSGESVVGEALVGADGLWSVVRRAIWPSATPQFAGTTAARAVIAANSAGPLAEQRVGLWLGAGANVVHYPVRGGKEIAVVVIAREHWLAPGWDSRVEVESVLARVQGFHHALSEVLARGCDYRKWSLYRLPSLPSWSKGRVGLIGDAAHPVLPHLAQGGALALEDAFVLGELLRHDHTDIPASLRRFEAERRGRAARVAALSRRNGRLYQLDPPLAWARDAALRLLPGAWLMAGYDWLYGWRPD
jgi:salicylate hydroxylase